MTRAPLHIRIAGPQDPLLAAVELELNLPLQRDAAVQTDCTVHGRHGAWLQRQDPDRRAAGGDDAGRVLDVLFVLAEVGVMRQRHGELACSVDGGDASEGGGEGWRGGWVGGAENGMAGGGEVRCDVAGGLGRGARGGGGNGRHGWDWGSMEKMAR